MKQQIKSIDRMSNTSYHNRCVGNQKYWWVRGQAGFVALDGDHRGDEKLNVVLELEPGTYTVGCGPQGKHGIRETVTVAEQMGIGGR